MSKLWLVAMLAAGCTSSSAPNPHEIVMCDGYAAGSGVVINQCEIACQVAENGSPPMGSGSQCTATSGSATDLCPVTFEFDGVVGCCKSVRVPPADPVTFQVRFYVCQ
jgi:hypothetical protein